MQNCHVPAPGGEKLNPGAATSIVHGSRPYKLIFMPTVSKHRIDITALD